jgi:hypothetical protein
LPPITRLQRIFENAGDDVDVIAIVNGSRPDPNFFYISGYKSGLFEGNLLFLFPDRHVEVLTNPLEEGAARANKGSRSTSRGAPIPPNVRGRSPRS